MSQVVGFQPIAAATAVNVAAEEFQLMETFTAKMREFSPAAKQGAESPLSEGSYTSSDNGLSAHCRGDSRECRCGGDSVDGNIYREDAGVFACGTYGKGLIAPCLKGATPLRTMGFQPIVAAGGRECRCEGNSDDEDGRCEDAGVFACGSYGKGLIAPCLNQ